MVDLFHVISSFRASIHSSLHNDFKLTQSQHMHFVALTHPYTNHMDYSLAMSSFYLEQVLCTSVGTTISDNLA